MNLLVENYAPLLLSFKLAGVTVFILLIISIPLAWYIARSDSALKPLWQALLTLPLVLPPTVLGFYLLIIMGSEGALGAIWYRFFNEPLLFSFTALIIASVIYSLPFVFQPILSAFEDLDESLLDLSKVLGVSSIKSFWVFVLPLSLRSIIVASVLGFAHTLGEFGVVLLVGGNIDESTRVASIAIYDEIELLNYQAAHELSFILLITSFLLLLSVFIFNRGVNGVASVGRVQKL